jgi:Domain of unknown function (DUF1905)/Bacteriocin-protection, YdeI or OmpD-Associated
LTTLRFRSRIEINNINPYVLVDADRAARLKKDWRRPMPVRIQVNGKPDTPWRINLMPVGNGTFYLYLHGLVRKAAGADVGDVVSLAIQFDDEYRGGPAHPMPSWFGDELDRNPAAKQGWDDLTPSRQKEILRYFAGLRSRQAQQRNVHRALHVLAGGKARFMARSWNAAGDE